MCGRDPACAPVRVGLCLRLALLLYGMPAAGSGVCVGIRLRALLASAPSPTLCCPKCSLPCLLEACPHCSLPDAEMYRLQLTVDFVGRVDSLGMSGFWHLKEDNEQDCAAQTGVWVMHRQQLQQQQERPAQPRGESAHGRQSATCELDALLL